MSAKAVLDLGPDLKLPALEAQTQTLVVYGGKGMGKTNFAAVFGEELDRANLRFSWIDPVGVAWGLKHSGDGKGPGVPVLILGGIHGDMPIEPTAGEVVADLVVDEDVSVIIDISRHASGKMWTHADKIRFVRDYCIRLFERQGERRRPIMQIIDEAGRFVPQQIQKGMEEVAACMGAIEQLVELGRNVGVGVALITQRSARMNKSVSELAEMMVAFRTVGPRSIDAIVDWFGEHVPRDQQKILVERLRQLDRGTALIVAPGWLRLEGEYALRARQTFDSSETPVAGQERRPTGKGAEVDKSKYLERMAETIEKAEENDPKIQRDKVAKAMKRLATLEAELEAATEQAAEVMLLRQTVKELERALEEEINERDRLHQVADQLAYTIAPQHVIGEHSSGNDPWENALEYLLNQEQVIDVPVPVDPEAIERLKEARTSVAQIEGALADVIGALIAHAEDRERVLDSRPKTRESSEVKIPPRPERPAPVRRESAPDRRERHGPKVSSTTVPRPTPPTAKGSNNGDPGETLPIAERKILTALAMYAGQSRTKRQVALLSGYSVKSGHLKNTLGNMRKKGYIEGGSAALRATDAGLAALGDWEPLPTGEALLNFWRGELGLDSAARKILDVLVEKWPNRVARDEAADLAGYEPSSGHVKNTLGQLRTLELIEGDKKSGLKASDDLFDLVSA